MKKIIKIGALLVFLLLAYIVFFLAIKRFSILNFSYDLLFIYTIIMIFISFHFIFDWKKMYDFIYRKRYIIGIILLFLLVLGKYNGSSIELWNDYVQPSYDLDSNIIIGVPRPIRSDEWLVSTPTTLTEATKEVSFSKNNSLLRGTDNLVTLYPNLPSKDISMLATPSNIGYLFLDKERAYSLAWYLPYFILFFATFEMFMILTKKNKLFSLLGSIMITLSPVIQWWQSPYIIAYGALAVTLFYYFILCDNRKKKLLLSILFGYSGYLYIMCLYPAWQVPYAYVYLIILIWIVVKNKDKIKKFDFLYLIPIFLTIVIPMYIVFKENHDVLMIINSTVYPGERMSTGGGEWRTLFSYVLDIFFPYRRGLSNPCEFSQYLSLYPVPIFYSIYVIIKNKKADLFLILANIVLVCLSIWVMFPLPPILSKLSLIYMSTDFRAQVAIGYLSVIEIIYLISNYQKDNSGDKRINEYLKFLFLGVVSTLIIFITVKISNRVIDQFFPGYVNMFTSIFCLLLFSIIMTLFLYNHRKTNYILFAILIGVSLISGVLVSPINKGLSVLYEKPLAKEIERLVDEDNNAIFFASDSGIVLSNYLVVNGAKTINSTNYVPNLDLYSKIDPDLEYSDVYNRYHHLIIDLTEDETNFILNQADSITLKLNYSDVCVIDADYIVTNNQNDALYDRYEKIYDAYDVSIYKTDCKGY